METSDRGPNRLALGGAILAAVIAAAGGPSADLEPGRIGEPFVGRTEAEAQLGVGPGSVALPWYPPVPLPEFERLRDRLRAEPWPAFAQQVLLWLWTAPEAPPFAEEGPPWHLELHRDGSVSTTPRLGAGRPARPPGISTADAARSVVVLVRDAESWSAERCRGLSLAVAALDTLLPPGGQIGLAGDTAWPAELPPTALQRPSASRR